MPTRRPLAVLAAFAVFVTLAAQAGPLRERLMERRAAAQGDMLDEDESNSGPRLPPGIRVLRDVAYGDDPAQRFDVYAPARAIGAPVILMLHGGGWARGDKGARNVVENKAARWVPRGIIFVSANYRMIPKADPVEQARDAARALAAVQARAADWGGDGKRVVLMGHSAGAHLAALLTASPTLAAEQGAAPWLGSVALDSGAFDVGRIMEMRHLPLYDRAFGSDPQAWRAASPLHALGPGRPSLLAVCSSRRAISCEQARQFAAKAKELGDQALVVDQDLSHLEINERLGLPGDYTDAVEAFLAGLDRVLAQHLGRR